MMAPLTTSPRALDLHLSLTIPHDTCINRGITAASVALAEAGVQMYGIVVGCSGVGPF